MPTIEGGTRKLSMAAHTAADEMRLGLRRLLTGRQMRAPLTICAKRRTGTAEGRAGKLSVDATWDLDLSGTEEMEAIAPRRPFPKSRITLDPKGAWALAETIQPCRGRGDILAYGEDPWVPSKAPGARGDAPSAGRTLEVPGTHAAGRQAPPPGGASSNIASPESEVNAGRFLS